MKQTDSLLIELGTEELPPKSLKVLCAAFTKTFCDSLQEAGVLGADTEIKSYATPRRLAIWVSDVAATQADFSQIRKGPAVAAAFDDTGEPTRAAQGFAGSCGVSVADLSREKSAKGEWLVFEQTVKGKAITECAQAALDAAITQLPIPKRMRWGNKNAEFVRPVHWLVALYGEAVLTLSALELTAGNSSKGHRFHHPDAVTIEHANAYSETLEKAFVVADFNIRRAHIETRCKALAKEAGGEAVLDAGLLDEVTALVEWPLPIMGEFDKAFLDVPREALVASMKDHQKYFHLIDADANLLAKFITVSNIDSRTPEKVLSGNERVLNARLSDAQFFWAQDKLHSLEANADRLEDLLFHVKLGSVADRSRRLIIASGKIARLIGADNKTAERAASLCKLDLVSNMVGEFASLQGTMGRYYALHDGEIDAVANAIEQHYWPKFAGDKLPESGAALALALADRLDTLLGIFVAGGKPSGVKDPYALRRAALGVLRILIEKKLDVSLQALLDSSLDAYAQQTGATLRPDSNTQSDIEQFIHDRLRAYYTGQGFDVNAFNAVAAVNPGHLYDFDLRIRAVTQFFESEKSCATALAAANKRIANILKKNPSDSSDYDVELFEQSEEHALAEALESIRQQVQGLFAHQHYIEGLSKLSALRIPVDTFFDEVRVIDDDEQIRHNRLALLSNLRKLFLQVSDISHLTIEA